MTPSDTTPAAAPATTATDETVPVLDAHRFDEAALARFMEANVEGYTPPLDVSQFQGGMSNPTFLLGDGAGRRYVLRKKPPGALLPSAHAVDREYRVISALAQTDVPVAKAYALCEDEAIIGQAFYIMEFVEGRVFRDITLPDLAPAERSAVYDAMGDVLARLHKVDYEAVGLGDYGRVGGYVSRQVRRWSQQYESSKTEDLAAMDKLMAWLPGNIPDDSLTTIAHGDYRIENLLYHPTEPRILAVVDWELGTLGNPFSDLAYNCLPYHMADERWGDITGIDYAATGIPSEADYVAKYCARTGRDDIPDWTFYLVLSLFRLAAIIQGVYYRGVQGNAPTPEALKRRDKCRELSDIAWALVQKGG
jgi:aminoglycoside phosphotransferase (APT) family kinase protein